MHGVYLKQRKNDLIVSPYCLKCMMACSFVDFAQNCMNY